MYKKSIPIILSFLCFAGLTELFALDNGLAITPPMGFNTWNWFGCGNKGHGEISEELIKGIADAIVSSGMKDAGYRYRKPD